MATDNIKLVFINKKEKYHLYMKNTNKNGLFVHDSVKYTVYLDVIDLQFIKDAIKRNLGKVKLDNVGIIDSREVLRIIKVVKED